MAAVMTAKAPATASKMKKPSLPNVQTGNNSSRQTAPSSSPSSSAKRPPGQTTPQSATNPTFTATTAANATNGAARPNRRLQRLTTRTATTETVPLDKKAAAKKFAAPYVSKESHILKKFKGRPPSLIVHLHPTHFRFDQQDGSFSYQSEMRIFIEHLQKKTIPHDMLEEFRKADVQFYDGWLIVRIIDHKSLAKDAANAAGQNDDSKPFSIHNQNNFVTPSPYAPYSSRESRAAAQTNIKQERQGSIGKENLNSDLPSDDTIDVMPKTAKPQSKIYHVALRPTPLSMHMDIALDAIAPDPKTLNRKQSHQLSGRTLAAGQPPTPIGTIPSTPVTEKPPPLKKQKLKIDPKDLLEYESRVVNATAPPLYLGLTENIEEVQQLLTALKDPWYDEAPPSPRSRKRTVAELAADDAHAKEQERFMLIMDERGVGNNNLANATGVDGQNGAASFQPRFEKFNVLDQIKREIEEKKQREKDRQLQEDEARRGQQAQEEERRRTIAIQQAAERRRQQQAQAQAQAQAQVQAQAQAQLAQQQAQQQQQQVQQQQQQQASQQQAQVQMPNQQTVMNAAVAVAAQRQQAQQQQQARMQQNRMPPQMQTQMAVTQASSPIVRQGTPQAASSPIVAAGSHPMVGSGSQQGQAGSPARPGSALQHAHPGVTMARGPSAQGPSRNGTPQMGHETPAMRAAATPVIRQGTPSQQMNHASPVGSMTVPTPQMSNAGMVGPSPQMANGIARPNQMTPQQMQEMQRQRLIQQQMAMNNGNAQMNQNGLNPVQMAQLRAQQQARAEHMMAMKQQQQQQQQQAMQQGTPQPHHMSPNPSQNAYRAQLAEQMKNQMQSVGSSNQGSPAPTQLTPQQQQQMQQMQAQRMQMMPQAQLQQQQQQQQAQQQAGGQVNQQMGQAQRQQINPQMQQQLQQYTSKLWQQLMQAAAQKYGGDMTMIPPQEQHSLQQQAQMRARQLFQQRQQAQLQQIQQRAQLMQQQQQGGNVNQMAQMAQMMQQQQQQGGNPIQNPQANQMAAQMHQHQAAQQMQALRMQHAQNVIAQGNAQMQYEQQLQNMQNMMNGQQR